jgi:hypothetical protein
MSAASYTLCRTCAAQPHREDDFIVRCEGRDVGRLYRDAFAGGARWSWTIFSVDDLRPVAGVSISGLAESLDEAKRAFQENYEKMVL